MIVGGNKACAGAMSPLGDVSLADVWLVERSLMVVYGETTLADGGDELVQRSNSRSVQREFRGTGFGPKQDTSGIRALLAKPYPGQLVEHTRNVVSVYRNSPAMLYMISIVYHHLITLFHTSLSISLKFILLPISSHSPS